MGNTLKITFLTPAGVDEELQFNYYALFPAPTVFTIGVRFKSVRVNPAEVTIGTDAISQAENYVNAFNDDYLNSSFTISRIGAVVTITLNNGSTIFNPAISLSSSIFATFTTLSNINITYQKANNSINAAYRPIVYRCTATISGASINNYIPPVVYCDIYLNKVYYKTISKKQFIFNNGTDPEYEFDIQDAVQEVLSYNLPLINGDVPIQFTKSIAQVYVKFRNAKFDVNGFIESEQLEPIQGTSSSSPVSGEGIQSNEIIVTNSTIQHEDNQEFALFLNNYKTNSWDENSYPLTRRPKNFKLTKNDSSYFPILTNRTVSCIGLYYKLKNSDDFNSVSYCYENCAVTISDVNYNGFFVGNNGIGNYSFSWTNLSPPLRVDVQVSVDDGLTYFTPQVTNNAPVVDVVNFNIYNDTNDINFLLKLTPVCINGLVGEDVIFNKK